MGTDLIMSDEFKNLSVIRTLDVGYVLKILSDKQIFNAISEDTMKLEHVKVDVINDYWVEMVDGDVEIGVTQFKPMFNKCYDAHIHILPEHRRKYSKIVGEKLLDWASKTIGDLLIYTTVPVFCPNVKDYLLSFDFEHSGDLKKAWLKNGVLNDMWIFTKRVERWQQPQQ